MADAARAERLKRQLAVAARHLLADQAAPAEIAFREATRIEPRSAEAHFGLGTALRKQKKTKPAIASLRRALALRSDLIDAKLEEGLALVDDGQLDVAAQCFMEVIERKPTSTEAPFQMGVLFQNRYQFDDAAECFRRVLLIDPAHAKSHANLGAIHAMKGDIAEAEESLRCALALEPNSVHSLQALATMANARGDFAGAMAAFDKALALKPDFASARFNRAVSLLRRGDFAAGLRDFDSRWELPATPGRSKLRPFKQPRWRGEPLNGGRLLVWGEQGIGDEIRMAAILPDLVARGENIMLECDPRLGSLFGRSFPSVEIVARATPPADATKDRAIRFQVPAEDLIMLRPSLESFRGHRPYLKPDADRVASVRETLATAMEPLGPKDRIVGISWLSKNAEFGDLKTSPLAAWAPILKTRHCRWVDLQYGDTTVERAALTSTHQIAPLHLPDLDLTKDIEGVAALIAACDLIITISNVTAHLAGALGKEAWVLLPFGHAQPWYWFAERGDSPWYPSLRLYRQRGFDDWSNVVKRVADDLAKWQPPPR
jgi:Tfp pilus assembly protein PilF